ncbi:MAG: hypothetical protein ABIJ42_04835, partial [Acidobacteriota bacterium]
SPKKFTISNTGKGMTSQAGLIPVVKFLHRADMVGLISNTINHQRGDNALYDQVDGVILTVVAIIGGARSLQAVTTVWADGYPPGNTYGNPKSGTQLSNRYRLIIPCNFFLG